MKTWLSIFFENALVKRVKRRLPIRHEPPPALLTQRLGGFVFAVVGRVVVNIANGDLAISTALPMTSALRFWPWVS